LVLIGDGPDFAKIQKKAGKNVELLGYQSTETLAHYMQRAKAFIFAAEEDFGIVLLEAQACGTPVIAYGKGGALETVRGLDQEAPTGVFFQEQSSHSLQAAILEFEAQPQAILSADCVKQASRFSPEYFREKFKALVLQTLA